MTKQILADKLGQLRSGEEVFDRSQSHINHQDSNLEKFLPLAFMRIDSNNKTFVEKTIDFGIEIGKTNCVDTQSGDKIVFAQREGRKGLSRFVFNKEKVPTSLITVVLKKAPHGYVLITSYFGSKAPPEPWDEHAEADSESFWSTHALIWDEEGIVKGTETNG